MPRAREIASAAHYRAQCAQGAKPGAEQHQIGFLDRCRLRRRIERDRNASHGSDDPCERLGRNPGAGQENTDDRRVAEQNFAGQRLSDREGQRHQPGDERGGKGQQRNALIALPSDEEPERN